MSSRSLVFSSVITLSVLFPVFAFANGCTYKDNVLYPGNGGYYPAERHLCSSFDGTEWVQYYFFTMPDGSSPYFRDEATGFRWFAVQGEAQAPAPVDRAGTSAPSSLIPDIRVEVFSASVVQLGLLSLNMWPPYRVMKWGQRLLKIAPNASRAQVGRLPQDRLLDRDRDR